MKHVLDRDIVPVLAQAVLGASVSVEIGISPFHPEWIKYLDEVGFLSNTVPTKKMLLPGYNSDLSSEMRRLPRYSLVRDVRKFLQEDWKVKTAPYSRLGFFVLIDRLRAFHSYPNSSRDSVRMAVAVPELTFLEHEKDLGFLIEEFDQGWKAGQVFETVYRDEAEDEDEEQSERIIQVSRDRFRDLIRYFDRHPEKMREMPPHDFEEFIASLFEKEGFKAQLTKMTRDGGRDILVTSNTELGKHLYLVECKRYAEHRRIDPTLIRSLYGVVEQERATAGLLVTTTRFTSDALKLINKVKNRISKKDYDDLVKWVKKHA